MSIQLSAKLVLVASLSLGVAAGSRAAEVVYLGVDAAAQGAVVATEPAAQKKAAFLGALASSQTETFGARPSTPVGGTAITADRSLFSSGVGTLKSDFSQSAPGLFELQDTAVQNNVFLGRFNTTGNAASPGHPDESGRWLQSSRSFWIEFSTLQQVFGTYITDLGDFDSLLEVSFMSGNTTLKTVSLDSLSGGQGALTFLGYTNDLVGFDKVKFTVTQSDPNDASSYDVIGFDDMTIGRLGSGAPMPEPGSLALVGLSLGLMAWPRRRAVAR